jgi:HrpA-like RNA helicase
MKTPLEQTLLQLKAIGVEDLLRFPYVTKPPVMALK